MKNEICGNELNFLPYKLSIRGKYVEALLSSKPFYERFVEIKNSKAEIDDKLVYCELESLMFPIADEESKYQHDEDFKAEYIKSYGEDAYKTMRRDYHSFKRALSQLSKVLYGDNEQWKFDYEAEYGKPYIEPIIKSKVEIPDENKDLEYLLEICNQLKISSLEKLLTEELTVKALREAGKITDIWHAYEVFKPVFFRCVRLGYKNNPETRRTYYRLYGVAEDFGNVLFDDKQHWNEDYNKWISKQNNEICGSELNFLSHTLTLNDYFIRDCLLSSNEFYNHFLNIKQKGVHIDDALVYQELKKMVFPIIHEELSYCYREDFRDDYIKSYGKDAYKTMQKDCARFRRALKRLSKVLYEDSHQWERDYEDEYNEPYIDPFVKSKVEIPDENKDLEYLLEICNQLKISSLEKLLTEELTVKALREAGKITDIWHAYEVFKPVFFRCVRLGYKNNPETRRTYYRLRAVAENFSDVLFDDEQHWHEDYAEWIGKQNNGTLSTD